MNVILLTLLLLLIFMIAVAVVCTQLARRLVPDPYEWLLVMNHHEWKRVSVLIQDILKLKKTKFSIGLRGIIYNDLALLEEEKLIETREVVSLGISLPLTEYRLTTTGVRKKNKNQSSN